MSSDWQQQKHSFRAEEHDGLVNVIGRHLGSVRCTADYWSHNRSLGWIRNGEKIATEKFLSSVYQWLKDDVAGAGYKTQAAAAPEP